MRLTTKCGINLTSNRPSHTIKSYDSTSSHISLSVEHSLKSLHTDYIDILLIHRPDYLMNPEEVAETFHRLKKSGKVLHFGVSNFTVPQFDILNSYIPLITNQIEISLLQRAAFEDGTLIQCLKHKIAPTAWSPFGGGEIFKEDTTNPTIQSIRKTAQAIAKKYDSGIFEVLLAWFRNHPSNIIPVLGTTKMERIERAKQSLDLTITHEEWYALWQAALGKEIA